MVVESAGKALVLFSGGEMQGDGDIVDKARIAMDAGATGLIFGRNVWQRPFDDAITLAKQFRDLLSEYSA